MIKAVIFDLDDTLYDYETINKLATQNLEKFVCRKFNINSDSFYNVYNLAKKQTKELLGETGSSHNRMLYCQKLLENLEKNPVEHSVEFYECYWNFMLENMKLNEGTIELLDYLKSNSIKIAICTDLTAHIQHRKINKLSLTNYIDALVTSEEAGAEKPSSKMYELIYYKLSKLIPNLKKEECLFVGDSLKKDVEGPVEFGMVSLRYSSMKAIREFLCHQIQ